MGYSKPVQSKFPKRDAADKAFVVTLDSGENVAVWVVSSVEPNTGNLVAQAGARVVTADGSDLLDAAGQTIESGYSFTSNPTFLASVGGPAAFQKLMLMTVMGEPANWPHALTQDVLDHASIRTNIKAAASSGAADPSTLL